MWRSPARRGTLRRTVRKDAGVRALGAPEFTCSPAADVFRPTPPYRSINHVRQEEVVMAERKHNVAREGIIAGVIGATSVALWFFVVDAVAGHPLATPG